MTGRGRRVRRTRRLVAVLGVALVAGLLAAGTPVRGETCPEGNLVPGAVVTGDGVRGQVRALADQFLPDEGTAWDARSAVVLAGPSASVRVDFGTVRQLSYLVLQADADDSYIVEGSRDGATFFEVWVAGPEPGAGLRFRGTTLDAVGVRQLRVRAAGGDGNYSVAEIIATCRVPERPRFLAGIGVPERTGWLTYGQVLAAKLTIALLALGLLLSGWMARRRGGPAVSGRVRAGALAVLGVAGALCWWNLGAFNYGRYLHQEELFHYFLGPKYFGELGYDRLYECAAAADAEAGFDSWVRRRSFRDLRTDALVSGAAVLERAGDCRKNFSPGRWRDFTLDLAWFRTLTPPPFWERMMQDHGYNGTPVWGLAGALLTGHLPATDFNLLALALLDPLLLVLLWGAAVAVFGWRAAAVGAIWFGTNLPAEFGWTGGGFLRQDWLLLTVVGLCLVRTGHAASGGGAFAAATLLRVYPGVLAAGLGLKALAGMWRRRSFSLERGHRRFAAGFLGALLLLGALSFFANPRGAAAWAGFVQDSRVDLSQSATNRLGLGELLSYDPKTLLSTITASGRADPVALWQQERSRLKDSRRWLHLVALAALSVVFLRSTRDAADWETLALGVGFIPVLTSFSSYYASVFLVYGLLWETRKEAVALPLVALAAWTQCAQLLWGRPDQLEECSIGISAGLLLTIALITALRPPAAQREPAASS
jgi:hypothetical protein